MEAGDIYAPRRGVFEITVPAFGRYALEQYPELRRRDTTPDRLVALERMRAPTIAQPTPDAKGLRDSRSEASNEERTPGGARP